LTRHDERAGTSDPASRLSASGAVPITTIERNGGCTIITGKTTTGTVATVHMIKLTETREITPYLWVHPDEER
jgi:hypothetical protein